VVKGKQSSLGGGTHWFWGWDTIFLKRGTQWFRGEARWFRRRTSVVLGAGQNCSLSRTQWFRGEARWFRRRTSVVLGAGQNCS